MNISLYDISIRSACILSLIGSLICIQSLFDPAGFCGNIYIIFTLIFQLGVLLPFAMIPATIKVFSKNKLQPSVIRKYLVYVTIAGLIYELMRGYYLEIHPVYGASCI